MPGFPRSLASLPISPALIAGAGLLAAAIPAAIPALARPGPAAPPGSPTETAMIIPRVSPFAGPEGLALPQPLSPSEAARVRRIFAWQARGDVAGAEQEMRALGDATLLGAILADRYERDPKRAGARRLAAWLARYGDQPDAAAI